LKSSKLKTEVVVKRDDSGLTTKKEVIVADKETRLSKGNVKVVPFANSRLIARVTIKVVPADSE
jgi:hypothetical protein